MKTILLPLLATLAGLLRNRAVLHLEILALRQQLAMVTHKDRKQRFRRRERLFWIWLCRIWPGRLKTLPSSKRTPWYVGIDKDFGSVGHGSRDELVAVDRRCHGRCGR